MLPVLFKIGPLTIHTYGFLLAIGVLTSMFLGLKLGKEDNIDTKDLSDLIFFSTLSGLLGAKIYLFFTEFGYYTKDLSRIKDLLTQAGAFYGGLIVGMLFAIWFISKKKMNFKKIGDIAGPSIALGHFFGRMGCFAAGCCFGRDAHGCSIGISFPDLAQETGVPIGKLVYPTQLMEAVLNLLNFIVLLFLYKKHRTFSGKIFSIYIFNYSLIRFFVEYFRGDSDRGYIFGGMESPFLSLSIPQLISIGGILLSVFLYLKFKKDSDKVDQ